MRNGKIARLPRAIRDQLNRRLHEGECGRTLLGWLNSLPEVQKVLKDSFSGNPINDVNMTQWRQGGYVDWLRLQEVCAFVSDLSEDTDELASAAKGQQLSDRLALFAAAELALSAKALLDGTTDPRERWELLQQVLAALALLRKADHRAARLAMERQRHQWKTERHEEELEEHCQEVLQREREEAEREIGRLKRELTEPVWAMANLPNLVRILGEEKADFITEVNHEWPQGTIAKMRATGKITVPIERHHPKPSSQTPEANAGMNPVLR